MPRPEGSDKAQNRATWKKESVGEDAQAHEEETVYRIFQVDWQPEEVPSFRWDSRNPEWETSIGSEADWDFRNRRLCEGPFVTPFVSLYILQVDAVPEWV